MDLRSNALKDAGVAALAGGLRHARRIKTLILSANRVGRPGVEALADGLQFCFTLDWLDLRTNDFTRETHDFIVASHFANPSHYVNVLVDPPDDGAADAEHGASSPKR